MSGEKSKKSGEYGELIVKKLFARIGWVDMIEKEDIKCFHPKLHALYESKERRTHGLDFVFHYESPLTRGVQNTCIISAKYCENYNYSYFKDYLQDISYSIKCFPNSKVYQTNVSSSIDIKIINGVIVWLSRGDEYTTSIYNEIKGIRNSSHFDFEQIFVIDNLRASFLYSVTVDLKKCGYDKSEFVYQSTGGNITSIQRKSSGKLLPIEFLTAPIEFLKITGKENILVMYCLFPFTEESFLRLIGLARDITENWADKIIIKYSDYDEFKMKNSISNAKSMYADKDLVEKISVRKYELVSFKVLEEPNA